MKKIEMRQNWRLSGKIKRLRKGHKTYDDRIKSLTPAYPVHGLYKDITFFINYTSTDFFGWNVNFNVFIKLQRNQYVC